MFAETSDSVFSGETEELSELGSVVDTGGSDGIHVAVRIRPLTSKEKAAGAQPCVVPDTSEGRVGIVKSGDRTAYLKSQAENSITEYKFDVVYDENSTQEEIFNRSVKKYVSKTIRGENVTVFAYGATGAGKTHTMMGNTRADSARRGAQLGIIPNCAMEIFGTLESYASQLTKGESWQVGINYLEVYNEQVYDLLNCTGRSLSLQEDPAKGVVHVQGLMEFPVKSYEELLELLLRGNAARKTDATSANAVSSRSHAVLQLNLRHVMLQADAGQEMLVESRLSLIDLAGSERASSSLSSASSTGSSSTRLQEGGNINKSLLALGNCISALAQRSAADPTPKLGGGWTPKGGGSNNSNNQPGFGSPTGVAGSASKKSTILNPKYRDSKLTHLLKSSLDGNSNIVMLANINPSHTTYDDSYHTLTYAHRAKRLKVNPTVGGSFIESSSQEREKRMKEENGILRNRIAELEQQMEAVLCREQQLRSALTEAMTALDTAELLRQSIAAAGSNGSAQKTATAAEADNKRLSRKRTSFGEAVDANAAAAQSGVSPLSAHNYYNYHANNNSSNNNIKHRNGSFVSATGAASPDVHSPISKHSTPASMPSAAGAGKKFSFGAISVDNCACDCIEPQQQHLELDAAVLHSPKLRRLSDENENTFAAPAVDKLAAAAEERARCFSRNVDKEGLLPTTGGTALVSIDQQQQQQQQMKKQGIVQRFLCGANRKRKVLKEKN